MEYWANDEDIMSDILELSDFCKFPQPAPEPSELMKKLRGKCSLFEDDFQEPESPIEAQHLPVRGHPLLKSKMKKPGGTPTTTNLRQTQALLREVKKIEILVLNSLLSNNFLGIRFWLRQRYNRTCI